MNVLEYGKENQQTIMLLHGGGLSWWNYSEAAELLKDRYHVILPILDGHGGEAQKPFISIQDCAEQLLSYIQTHFNGHIQVLSGFSLGAQIAVTMLSMKPYLCDYAMLELSLIHI